MAIKTKAEVLTLIKLNAGTHSLQLSTLLKTSHDTSFKPFNLSYFNYLFTSFPLLAWFSTFTFLSSDVLTTAGKLLTSVLKPAKLFRSGLLKRLLLLIALFRIAIYI